MLAVIVENIFREQTAPLTVKPTTYMKNQRKGKEIELKNTLSRNQEIDFIVIE